ncbi:hypothetical protein ZWY2020_035083 [Hordeum vulgare]|nr:hypothetical protein ZWY2020_035083 [Hordeum vulgare]
MPWFGNYRVGKTLDDGRLCITSVEDQVMRVWVHGETTWSDDNGWHLEREMNLTKVYDTAVFFSGTFEYTSCNSHVFVLVKIRMDDDECPAADGSFSTRFLATRLRQIANHQPKKKKDVIRKCSFGSFLNINLFSVPVDLLDWVVMKIDPVKALFSHGQKSILFIRDMVRKKNQCTFWVKIVYMDFVEVPHLLASEHRIDYSLPRSFFVCNDNFKLIEEIDRNKLSLDKIDFGKRNIPSHMIPIYDKHKKLHATEVKKVLKSFGQVLEGMFSGNAADVDHTRAPILTSPEAHKSPAAQELDVDREVTGCTNTGQNEAHRGIGLEKMQSCGFQGMEDVQQGPVAALQGLAMEFDDGPSMSMFKEGIEDFEWFNMDADMARKYKEANKGMETPTHVKAGPTYDNC